MLKLVLQILFIFTCGLPYTQHSGAILGIRNDLNYIDSLYCCDKNVPQNIQTLFSARYIMLHLLECHG